MFPQSLHGVSHRPLVRILLILLFIVILFVALYPLLDASHLLENVSLPLQHQPPRPPLHSSPFISPHPKQQSGHRIKVQRPPAEPAHDGGPWAQRADTVRGAFLHAYQAYLTHAASHDELRPLTNSSFDDYNGWGVTVVDSLDTMWLMGLYDEFDAGLALVADMTFPMDPVAYTSFFETVIRYLGGLLSAYALSKDPILLTRADYLGFALLPVFRTASGLPMEMINTVNGQVTNGWRSKDALFSGMLTCQLEYKYLSYLTGRMGYYEAVEKVMDIVYKANVTSTGELFPLTWSRLNGSPVDRTVTVGGAGDSAYEYMLKQWLLTGRSDTKARDLYLRSVDAILDHLTYLTPSRNLLYVTDASVDFNGDFTPSHKLEHLTCFLPGILALGAVTLPDVPQRHMWAARAFAQTCWLLYADSPSGLAPDEVMMRSSSLEGSPWVTHLEQWEQSGGRSDPPGVGPAAPVRGSDRAREYVPIKTDYNLRPETVESFYLLWRTTGDVVWRERGWEVFEALQRETRVESGGFAGLKDAYRVLGPKHDEMPSWFLAETLKYLFLLFTDEDLVPLDEWVFNTEAHPLPVFQWSEWEMERLGIARGISVENKDP